jgi:hypothetical protein
MKTLLAKKLLLVKSILKILRKFLKRIKNLKEIHAGKELHGKMVYDSINNFTINTSTIYITTVNNLNVITIKVQRSVYNNLVENLVLISDINGDYIVHLYQYNFNADELEDYKNGISIVNLHEKLVIIPLEGFNASIFDRNDVGTTQIYILDDGRCGIFISAEVVNGEIVAVFLIVPSSGGGGSTSGNNNVGVGGPSGSGYNWGFIFNDWRNNGGNSSGVTGSSGLINLSNDANDYYFSINTPVLSLPQNDTNITELNDFQLIQSYDLNFSNFQPSSMAQQNTVGSLG